MARHTQQEIPVIDFSAYSLDKDTVCKEKVQALVDEIHQAFSNTGFVYLENHGVDSAKVRRMYEVSKKFFALPKETKMKSCSDMSVSEHGYVQIEQEKTNPQLPHGDLKESFNYVRCHKDKNMPDEDLPELREVMDDFYKVCTKLTQRVLELMAMGLNIEPSLFPKAHKGILDGENETAVRTLYYPAVSTDCQLKPGQERCGEHSDYGSITLLFQDDAGGLEVMNTQGNYIAAIPIENTIVINLGDLMQRWTADKLKATKHRVVVPKYGDGMQRERQSIVFFVFPDKDFVVECLDNSNKYPPIKTDDYLTKLLNETY